MTNRSVDATWIVVGAGVAGLLAARHLRDAGHDVVVVDKGRKPGGRIATRHFTEAVFDHGAQFITATDERFQRLLSDLERRGVVDTWFFGAPEAAAHDTPADAPQGHPRFRGVPYQRALAEHLAADLDVRLPVRVTAIHHRDGRWELTTEHRIFSSAGLVVTAPAPQSLSLVRSVALPRALTRRLAAIDYDPCVATMVVLDRAVELGNRGALRLDEEPIAFLGDNHAKGTSPVPALTIHAGPTSSREWWDHDRDQVGARLLAAAAPWLDGATGRVAATHRWRYSRPAQPTAAGDALVTTVPGPIAFAGDGLGGGRVEGAALSGLAAAEAVLAFDW